ncbi:NACHT domain-containing protein [Streptomyces cyaneofuscatus]|uniref:NACHT domain-containing protein n=1 Tax=Streptomyces cyaneofuscatus TaxID=66883 RepID=UPI0036364E2D
MAAYGLRGIPLPFFASDQGNVTISSLQFETEDAVDDIRCNMTDGSYAVIQAKRSCGNDKHLTATVDQWVRQISTLGDSDKVAIVVRNLKGPLKYLKDALDNNRAPLPRQPSKQMEEALKAILSRVPADVSSRDKNRLIKSAYCIEARTEKEGDSHFDNAVALLDGVIVDHGFGVVAVKILQQNFQQGAATGIGSSVKDWILWFQEGGLQPRSEPAGSPGQQAAAENIALENFLQEARSQANKLQYSLLAEDLPILDVPDLARSFQVSLDNKEKESRDDKALISVARRWRRFNLVGFPGSGKSVAVRQIAAQWAIQPGAPIPIVVPLRRVAERVSEPSDVTLELLVEVGIEATDSSLKGPLRRIILTRIKNGEAALLLDGLDECRTLSGVVSIGIQQIMSMLHECNSVIVTGRDSSLPASKKLNLPTVRLTEPSFLDRTMANLLSAIADLRIPAAERESWLTEKRRNISKSKKQNPDIWRVPLLATMLTLLSATTEDASLPSNRSKILHAVVQNSIRKWELGRGVQPPGGWNTYLNSAKLLDGFATIGHTINNTKPAATAEVDVALKSMLTERWGSSRGEAEYIAPDIRWFWDENVGVFVSTDGGRSTAARSRQFIEIAEAIWASQQEKPDICAWLALAIQDGGMQETVVLAAGLSSNISAILMDVILEEESLSFQLRATSWLILSQEHEVTLPADRVKELIEEVSNLYASIISGEVAATSLEAPALPTTKSRGYTVKRQRQQLEVDGLGWEQIVLLAQMHIPTHLRSVRDGVFAALELDFYKRKVLLALVALTDANADGAALNSAQEYAVRDLLEEELTREGGSLTQVSRRSFRIEASPNPLLSGHYSAGMLAVRHLGQLGSSVHQHLKELAEKGPASRYHEFADPLRRAGVEIETVWTSEAFKKLMDDFGEDDFWGRILEPITEMPNDSQPPASICPDRDWRMTDLVDLLEMVGIAEVGIQDYRLATDADVEQLPLWLKVFAKVSGINYSACAYQASAVLDDDEDARLHDYDFLFTSLNHPEPELVSADADDIRTLTSIIECAQSDWMASVAWTLLAKLQDVRSLPHLERMMTELAPVRRRMATAAWCLSSPDPVKAATEAYATGDPAAKGGVGIVLSLIPFDDPGFRALRGCVMSDEDATVRWFAEGSQGTAVTVAARVWSCLDCANLNEIDAPDCQHCATGSRPD